MNTNDIILNCPLFSGISAEELSPLPRVRKYTRQNTIIAEGSAPKYIGVVVEGSVQIVTEDYTGNRTIMAALGAGDIFGESFACAGTKFMPVSVVAGGECSVLMFDYSALISGKAGEKIAQNLLKISAAKNIRLSQKLALMSRRTTREKLTAYFSELSKAQNTAEIVLPFTRQELADYLCAERSALCRELGKMKRDGLISARGRKILLRKQQ